MKDKKKMRLVVVLVVLLLGGLVYYWFFYTAKLGHYVYLESRNSYSAIAHSKEDCSRINGGLRRYKTSWFLSNINSAAGLQYCSKCMTCDMLIEYSKKYNVPISKTDIISSDNANSYVCEERSEDEIAVSVYSNEDEEEDEDINTDDFDDDDWE